MREITIKASRSAILSELAKYSHTVGEQLADDAAKARHFIQSATDSGHLDLLVGRLDEAWMDLRHTLSAYTKAPTNCKCGCTHEVCSCCSDDQDTEESADAHAWDTDYSIVLYFPTNTADGIGWDVAQCVKRYLVACARGEWEQLSGRGIGDLAEAQAQRALSRLRVIINTRI